MGEARRACTPHLTAAFFSLSLLLSPRAAGVQRREQLVGREYPKGIYTPLFALPPSVHFWDRVQRRREEGGTESRTSDSATQLSVPPCSRDT